MNKLGGWTEPNRLKYRAAWLKYLEEVGWTEEEFEDVLVARIKENDLTRKKLGIKS